MRVRPAPDVLLRDPVTKRLLSAAPVKGKNVTVIDEGGMEVSDHDLYWARRLRDNDAVLVTNTTTDEPLKVGGAGANAQSSTGAK